MPVQYPRFKAAACHAASVFLDVEKTVEKACDFIQQATRAGAALVVFPESFLPGFPLWAALHAPIHNHDKFRWLAANALRSDGAELARIRKAAMENNVFVSIGITEGTEASVGCLWNSNVLIGPDGAILNWHRKLVPTFYEKLVWAGGDARGLRVNATPIGKLGMLICGENTNPLARYALMAQGEQVHISSYPPIWPTRPPGVGGNYDLRRAIELRAAAHSFEAKAFNVVSSGFLDKATRDALGEGDPAVCDILDKTPRGASMIIGPTAVVLSDVISDEEGIAYADIDVEKCVEPKQFHDVVGSYNRFDVFELRVNRQANEPARFNDGVFDAQTGPLRRDLFSAPDSGLLLSSSQEVFLL